MEAGNERKSAGGRAAAYADGLNPEQRRAVEFGLHEPVRPLIVLAGPGTGKTKVIVHRVARLIEAGCNGGGGGGGGGGRRVDPGSILAVTFTVNAARQMRQRLGDLVGRAVAERVNVHTFHGFGLRLLRRYGDVLGMNWAAGGVQLIDSAQRKRLLLELIHAHGLFAEYAPVGRETAIPGAEAFIAACRSRGVFPDECGAHAKAWGARCEGGVVEGVDDGELAAERERRRAFEERSRLYGLFDAACRERGWITFDDLIMQPIRLLRERPGLAAVVRDEYRHIVVDEFQDVNGAQIELLRLLAPATAGGAGRDLCVVGDDDQAIYAFRGSSQRAFGHFSGLWPGHETVTLTDNYRSVQPVLEAANAIIGRATGRFAPDKRVVVAPASPARKWASRRVEGVVLEDDAGCGEAIAAMIRAEREGRAAGSGEGPRPWSEFAIIARQHTDLERIVGDLELHGIPYRYVRTADYLSDNTILDLQAWIALLADGGRARWAAQRLLVRPPHGVPAEEVSGWVMRHRAELSRAGMDSEEGGREAEPFVAWLSRQGGIDHVGARRFLDTFAELSRLSLHERADAVVMRIIERAGLASPSLAGDEDDTPIDARAQGQRITALVSFLRFVRSRLDRLEQPHGIAEFWAYFQDLDERDRAALASDDEERIDDDAGGDGPAAPGEVEEADAVTLLTAHRAKGLEFPVVFLPRVRPRGYPAGRRDEEDPLPRDLLAAWQRGLAGGDQAPDGAREDEERRLFYVACTRAMERLVLLAKKKKSRGDATDFFIELTLDVPLESPLVDVRPVAEVLGAAAGGGNGSIAHTSVDALDAAGGGAASGDAAARARRLGARQVRAVRDRLAELANLAEVLVTDAAGAADAAARGAEQVARLAVASHLERHGRIPEWALAESSPARGYARALADQLAGAAEEPASPLRAIAPPLRLTYSTIDAYERCPRCYYLRNVLGLSEGPDTLSVLGEAAHAALERFYRAFRDADAGEGSAPTADDLLRYGREAFLARSPRGAPIDRGALDKLLGQLRLAHQRLHSPDAHILEVERTITFGYPREGHTHIVTSRLDRIDQLPDGRFAIIDFKTGYASKRLAEPKRDDLQLGLYAMALRHLYDSDGTAAPAGQAEYWLLSVGERGVIDLSMLDEAAVRQRIDATIDGLLAGRFDPSPQCEGACRVFGVNS